MKTLKLYLVAILLASAFVISANPISKASNVAEAQQELYKDFKKNLTKWNVIKAMCDDSDCEEFVVRGYVDETNTFNIASIVGKDEQLKKVIQTTNAEHPIQVSEYLVGHEVAFRLKFIKR